MPGFGGRMRIFLKVFSVAILVLLVIMALGPGSWQPRTGLGWEFDHFAGYFAITTIVCLAWPRPIVVGGALMAFGALLEGLQAFTPDRSSNLMAALYGAGGALAAALIAELYIRAFSNKASEAGQRIFGKAVKRIRTRRLS
jgi:VanZ family protein